MVACNSLDVVEFYISLRILHGYCVYRAISVPHGILGMVSFPHLQTFPFHELLKSVSHSLALPMVQTVLVILLHLLCEYSINQHTYYGFFLQGGRNDNVGALLDH